MKKRQKSSLSPLRPQLSTTADSIAAEEEPSVTKLTSDIPTETRESRVSKLAVKAERVVEGLFLFLLRYVRTIGLVVFMPWRAHTFVTTAEPVVLPLTYLSIAYFLYSILIDVSTTAYVSDTVATSFLDVVWMSDDVAKRLIERLQAGISLTLLTIAALPGIVIVFASSYGLGSLVFPDRDNRTKFTHLACYAFGTQCLVLFMMVCEILYEQLGVVRILALPGWLSGPRTSTVVPFVFFPVTLWALIAPDVFLVCGARHTLKSSGVHFSIRHLVLILLFALVVPTAFTYVGRTVGRTYHAIYPLKLPETIIVGNVLVAHNSNFTTMHFNVALRNPGEDYLSLDGSNVALDLIQNETQAERHTWRAKTVITDPTGSGDQSLIVVLPRSVRAIRIRAVFAEVPISVIGEHGAGGHGAYCLKFAAYTSAPRVESSCQYRTFEQAHEEADKS
jgi:hypothetical protein